MLAVGLMSGTSLDGIDAALVEIVPRAEGYDVACRAARTVAFPAALERRIRAALPPNEPAPRVVAALDEELGAAFGEAAAAIAGDASIGFVASHGLTLFHEGESSTTVQIGDPFSIREAAGATVLYDFRRADCAAGGHGAPLVPYVDALLLGSPDRHRVALNLGGIANLTLLAPGARPDDAVGWDVGPANMLLDAFVAQRTAARERFDRDGAYAERGASRRDVVERMLADDYFSLEPPKTTGRERFGDAFIAAHAGPLDELSLEDGCATLIAVTVEAIARALRGRVPDDAEIVVSGGGARNPALLRALRAVLAPRPILASDACGVDAEMKEALAFVVLGYELLRGRAAGMPRVTGARYPALLGAIAPQRLDALLRAVDKEVRDARAPRP